MDEFYTVNQAALILKVHPLTIRRYLKEGKLRGYRIAGNIRISQEDLRSLMQGFTSSTRAARPAAISLTKPFTHADPLFRMKARGLSMSRVEQ
jgi:excisionase family DNA binding protein